MLRFLQKDSGRELEAWVGQWLHSCDTWGVWGGVFGPGTSKSAWCSPPGLVTGCRAHCPASSDSRASSWTKDNGITSRFQFIYIKATVTSNLILEKTVLRNEVCKDTSGVRNVMFLNFFSRLRYPREEQGVFHYRAKERQAEFLTFFVFFCQPLQLYLLFAAFQWRKKISFSYLLPLQVLLFSDATMRLHDKKKKIKDRISTSFMYLPTFIRTSYPGDWLEKHNKKPTSHFWKPERHKIQPQKRCLSLNRSQTSVFKQHLCQKSKPQLNSLLQVRDRRRAMRLACEMVS